MNGRGRFNGATLSVLYIVMSQTEKNASKKKKKFNHTALYTDILSNRHSHLHVNNAPGSTAPPVTLGDPQIRPQLGSDHRSPSLAPGLPRAAAGCVLVAAQVWSQRKADKTRHALASYFVSFFFPSKI